MRAERDGQFPSICLAWLGRWLSEEAVQGFSAASEGHWSDERIVCWCFRVVDVAVRGVSAQVFARVGADEPAALLRSLPELVDQASAERAVEELGAAANSASEWGLVPLHFSSTRAAVSEVMYMAQEHEAKGVVPEFSLESLFAKSGALDMAAGRAIASGLERDVIVGTYRERLLAGG